MKKLIESILLPAAIVLGILSVHLALWAWHSRAFTENDLPSHLEAGNMLLENHQWEPALERFRRALKSEPQNFHALVGKIEACIELGKYERAAELLTSLERRTESEPEPARVSKQKNALQRALHDRAEEAVSEQRWADARKPARLLKKLDPHSEEVQQMAAEIKQHAGADTPVGTVLLAALAALVLALAGGLPAFFQFRNAKRLAMAQNLISEGRCVEAETELDNSCWFLAPGGKRLRAELAESLSSNARNTAAECNAPLNAANTWEKAEERDKEAENCFEEADYKLAETMWLEAKDLFDLAAQQAGDIH